MNIPKKKFILTNKLNQDPVENLFALIRIKGGNNKNPSVYDFNRIMGRIVSNKLLAFSSENTNCIEYHDNFILLDDNEIENEMKVSEIEVQECEETENILEHIISRDNLLYRCPE